MCTSMCERMSLKQKGKGMAQGATINPYPFVLLDHRIFVVGHHLVLLSRHFFFFKRISVHERCIHSRIRPFSVRQRISAPILLIVPFPFICPFNRLFNRDLMVLVLVSLHFVALNASTVHCPLSQGLRYVLSPSSALPPPPSLARTLRSSAQFKSEGDPSRLGRCIGNSAKNA